MEDILFDLYYKQAHRNEELEMTIEELQTELKYRKNENKSLYKEISRLRDVIEIKDTERIELVKENTTLKNDYKQTTSEIKLLNNQIDKLIAENNDLKHRRKILVKHLLNIMYGFDYAGTVSEDKE